MIYTTQNLTKILGIKPRRVQQLIKDRYDIKPTHGYDLTQQQLDNLKIRKPGKPKKSQLTG